ncbi:MAG: hypothetical protein JKX71_07520 [Amylibacter sp.]|nr:hypothetical protein [Amylibacter sp.]
MAKKKTLLERMAQNPKDNWQIKDVETLCKQVGIYCEKPSKGSHYKVYGDHIAATLTIPAHKPIRYFYIKNLTSYATMHLEIVSEKDKES